MANKYNASPTTYKGIKFASKKEMSYYRDVLESKLFNKEISVFKLQPKFTLQPSFTVNGKTIQPITYTADFSYYENGKFVVVEVKGFKTRDYTLRKKMLLYKFRDNPNFVFKEV